jgi:ATP-dependent DNA helicase RecG
VPYNRIAPREAEQKVIMHIREYERITNRTVRNLLDFNVHQASALLRSLCDSGLLAKTSHQQRGTAVEYGPGPAFPDA